MRLIVFFFVALCTINSQAGIKEGAFFLSSSAFMLMNLDQETKEPPRFAQLNLGYQASSRDTFSIELITWRYYKPHGALWETSSPSQAFPGHVTSHGAGFAYQRFLGASSNFYLALHATWLRQEYHNTANNLSDWGYQLFATFRAGYRFEWFNGRLFLEPSIAVTHWPIETGMPPDFQAQESKWTKFQVEPGAHFGITF
jgi:hypothetical protein